MAVSRNKGYYKPRNPKKWINPKNIVYRSGWEFKFMGFLDNDERVIRVASEEISIVYFNPQTQRSHRYFPDFLIQVKKTPTSPVETTLIEIKPKKECSPPINKGQKTFLKEAYTYAVNQMKWDAARKWCEERGFQFKIMTEAELGV